MAAMMCSFCVASPQGKNGDDEIWKAYVAWLDAQPPNKPAELIDGYRRNLEHEGLPHTEAERRMRVVGEYIFTRHKGIEVFWNKVFGAGDRIYLETPSQVVVEAVKDRKPGTALDIGMGQGRNAVFLAAQGWNVTGFDPSEVAVRMARSNAEKTGIKINAEIARDDEFDYGTARWDLILMAYVRDLNAADARLFRRALKPGGIVVYENGANTKNEVLKSFLGLFRIVRFDDVETTADWNPERKTRLQRMVAEKN